MRRLFSLTKSLSVSRRSWCNRSIDLGESVNGSSKSGSDTCWRVTTSSDRCNTIMNMSVVSKVDNRTAIPGNFNWLRWWEYLYFVSPVEWRPFWLDTEWTKQVCGKNNQLEHGVSGSWVILYLAVCDNNRSGASVASVCSHCCLMFS